MVLIWSYKNKTHSRILGVTFQADLSSKNHIADKMNKANCMLGIIKEIFEDYGRIPLLCYTNPSFDLSWSMLTRYEILIKNRISKH